MTNTEYVKADVLQMLKDLDIQASTISFYNVLTEDGEDAEDAEGYFGTCDLSGMQGDVVPCLALNSKGKIISFEAGTWLVHGILGKLAGAF